MPTPPDARTTELLEADLAALQRARTDEADVPRLAALLARQLPPSGRVGKVVPITADQVLILTVGLPYSGKSTWAHDQPYPVVSPDAIRVRLHGGRYLQAQEPLVWALVRFQIESLFLSGHCTVVLDACHARQEWRDEWLQGPWNTEHVLFEAPGWLCRERARSAGDDAILPIIERMALAFEPPTAGVVLRVTLHGEEIAVVEA